MKSNLSLQLWWKRSSSGTSWESLVRDPTISVKEAWLVLYWERKSHLPEPFLCLYHSPTDRDCRFSWFSDRLPANFHYTNLFRSSHLFVPLSIIAYVLAPPSFVPGEGFGITGSTSCAPYLAEKGWRMGTGGAAAAKFTTFLIGVWDKICLKLNLTHYINIIWLHCLIIENVMSYFEMCDS